MQLKICKDCKKSKPKTQFYGVQNECKECTKKRVKSRYYDPETRNKIAEYEKKRFNDPARRERIKLYALKRKLKSPGKIRARKRLNNAIRDGKISRKPCMICGNQKSQAHHVDYRKYSDVIWLCFKHHREVHNQIVN